ncbi:MAG: hypothetical protein K1X35_06165 [Caulobacteraceae bacterium]|nr:hypothetical protein [Caulobacteraceae bacterium]
MPEAFPATEPQTRPRGPRVDLIAADPLTRTALGRVMEEAGLRVIDHLPGVEVDFAGPPGVDPACVVIVHDAMRLDALVLTVRLRSIGLTAPILILKARPDTTFHELAECSGGAAVLDFDPADPDPGAVAARVLRVVDEPGPG